MGDSAWRKEATIAQQNSGFERMIEEGMIEGSDALSESRKEGMPEYDES